MHARIDRDKLIDYYSPITPITPVTPNKAIRSPPNRLTR